jgi:hypothetical protein
MREPDHVGRIERQPRGRQAEGGAFPADPGFHQRAAAAAFGLLGRDRHREGLGGDARRVDGDAAGLDEGRVVILVGAGDLPLQRLRQFGLLAAGQLESLALAAGDQIVDGQRGDEARPRMTKRITPSVSMASKPKWRASVEIDARGLSSAPIT